MEVQIFEKQRLVVFEADNSKELSVELRLSQCMFPRAHAFIRKNSLYLEKNCPKVIFFFEENNANSEKHIFIIPIFNPLNDFQKNEYIREKISRVVIDANHDKKLWKILKCFAELYEKEKTRNYKDFVYKNGLTKKREKVTKKIPRKKKKLLLSNIFLNQQNGGVYEGV